MTKSDLSAHVAARASVPRTVSNSVLNAVFTAIGDALARDETVVIAGFGTFTTKRRAARQGRHPRTGERIAIAASRVPAFKPAKALRDTVRD